MDEKKLIIFTDIGDTIVDEGTEIRKPNDRVVYGADCIDGAKETLLELHARGYTIVMVADGLVASFRNTMEQKAYCLRCNRHRPCRPILYMQGWGCGVAKKSLRWITSAG